MLKPFVSLVSLVFLAAPAAAQTTDSVGVRARGMAGAFTAVADDATASWWNPAGLAGGAYFNALIETGHHQEPSSDRTSTGEPQSAWRSGNQSYAVAFPALGLSYYRLRVSGIQPLASTATAPAGRQEGGATEVRLRSVVLSQFGATIGQSLGEHLVIGSTLKLVSGGVASEVQPASTGSLDAAADLPTEGQTHGGLDIGAMAVFGRARIGVMVRNVTPIQFDNGLETQELSRQARLGGALSTGTRGVIGAATLAIDADLTRVTTVFGEERRIAGGGEAWTSARTLGVRAGVSVNTIGDRRTAVSGGLSTAVKKGLYADASITGGTDLERRGWAVGMRVTF